MPIVKLTNHKTMTTSEVEVSQHEYDMHQAATAAFWGLVPDVCVMGKHPRFELPRPVYALQNRNGEAMATTR